MAELFLEPVFAESQSADKIETDDDVAKRITALLADFEFQALRSGKFLARCLAASCLKPTNPREVFPPPRQPFVTKDTPEEVREWAVRHAHRSHGGPVPSKADIAWAERQTLVAEARRLGIEVDESAPLMQLRAEVAAARGGTDG